ncbi:MAG: hypothetical protein NVSMB27_17450 [Ktedonobacteraceae bacterium]
MGVTQTEQSHIIRQKLTAFERLQAEFEECFRFVQDVHGQKRFPAFSVADSVHYLHALWICECKDRLLSIYKNIRRYEGRYCLELMQAWQEGNTADVVDFLHRKLDMLPLADITRQLHEALQQKDNHGMAERLSHGRSVLLNRGMNLMQALDAIFKFSENQLVKEVQVACMQYGHHHSQIKAQLAEMETPLYSYIPHRALAQQNMVVMNKLGVEVMTKPTDQPGQRSWRVLEPAEPMRPFAEHIIEGYQELTSPIHNNIRSERFIDRPEGSDTMQM